MKKETTTEVEDIVESIKQRSIKIEETKKTIKRLKFEKRILEGQLKRDNKNTKHI